MAPPTRRIHASLSRTVATAVRPTRKTMAAPDPKKYRPLLRPDDKPAVWLNKDTMDRFKPQLQKFYYEVAQANHPGALAAIAEIIPLTQLLFGTDYPIWRTAESVGGVSSYKGFSDAQRQAVNRGTAERLFPKFKS